MTEPTTLPSAAPIAALPVGGGRLGLTACPARGALAASVAAWQRWGARHVLTLLPQREQHLLGIGSLGDVLAGVSGGVSGGASYGTAITWHRLAIPDFGIPDDAAMVEWARIGPVLHRALDQGAGVLLHCRAGLGRSGTVAALILCERGVQVAEAISRIRITRPGAIETDAQERWLHDRPAAGRAVG